MWVRQRELENGEEPRSPIPTRIASNEEFIPPPQTPEQKEVEARLAVISDEAARGWLYGIARNLVRQYHRRGRVELATCRKLGIQLEHDHDELSAIDAQLDAALVTHIRNGANISQRHNRVRRRFDVHKLCLRPDGATNSVDWPPSTSIK